MHYDNMGTTIVVSRDRGHYDGTRPEYNVRKLKQVRRHRLTITHPVVKAIIESHQSECYGRGMGDTGTLCPVSEADVVALQAAEIEAKADRRASRQTAPAWVSPRGLTLTQEMDREDSIY